MKSTFIAVAALAATASASTGNAIVVNKCAYSVLVKNVPSNDGVHTEVDTTLAANGGKYTQQYTELANLMGWSIKMAPTAADFSAGTQNVAQYEYTNCGDGSIWFDMSFVDGSQWMNDWSVSSDSSSCSPSASNYFSDPTSANGMQAQCDIGVSVTVTLCSSSGSGSSGSSSSSSSSAAASTSTKAASSSSKAASTSTQAASSSTQAASTSTQAASSSTSSLVAYSSTEAASSSASAAATSTASHRFTRTWNQANVVVSTAVAPTTFATAVTSVSSANSGNVVVTVTDVATAYATVVETVGAVKRRDQHQHHAARHPHAGRA